MKRRELHPEADEELAAASEYIDDERPGHGEEFLQKAEEAFRLIAGDPEIWGVRLYGFRKYTIPKFKYQIWYKENETGIYIIAVAHPSRKPGYWRKRI